MKARTASPTAGRSSRHRPPRRKPSAMRKGAHLYELLRITSSRPTTAPGRWVIRRKWVAMAKRSIATIAPRFSTSIRMVSEYVRKFYAPAANHGPAVRPEHDFAVARNVADWKAHS